MARTGLTRRIEALEGAASVRRTSLDHLTDDELEAYGLDLIAQFGEAGVPLPDDWRDRYRSSPIRFIEEVEQTVRRLLDETA